VDLNTLKAIKESHNQLRFKTSKYYGDSLDTPLYNMNPDDKSKVMKTSRIGPYTPEAELWTNLESRSLKLATIPEIN